jgi:hypothetical protein
VIAALMVLVGSRQVWNIWKWDVSSFLIVFSDLGLIFPTIVAGLLLFHSPTIRRLVFRTYDKSKFLVLAIVALWFWLVFESVLSGDFVVFISVAAQSEKS